jgi:hypothetical protein
LEDQIVLANDPKQANHARYIFVDVEGHTCVPKTNGSIAATEKYAGKA